MKLNPRDADAVRMVEAMDALFRVEREARQQGLPAEARMERRGEVSVGIAEAIRAECIRLTKSALPQSATAKGAAYTLNQWARLRRCLELPEAELSNNIAENSMRPIALGRKNWLHVDSAAAGPKVAAILSVVESCRRMRLPVKNYLADIMPGLGRRMLSEVRTLTPASWAARQN